MAGEEKWYFSKDYLAATPTRRCGIDVDKELSYRQQAANFIQDMGQRLKVTLLCINTAIVYMHRFYVFHSFSQFPWHSISSAALFLAAKVEEQPRKLEHVIKVAHVCLHRETSQLDTKSEQYLELTQDLVFNENVLLQTLGFDVAIDHPHTHVVRCCHLIRASKDLAQTSYFMASNSLHLTTMCVQYKPTVVACFCIHLACKWSNWEIPLSSEGKEWFWYVDKTVTMEQLERLTAEFLVIYDKCPSKLRRKIRSASTHNPNDSQTSIPDNNGEIPFKFSDSDPKFSAPIQHGPTFELIQKQGGSSDKSQPSTSQVARSHGEPSTSRGDNKEKIRHEKPQLSNKSLPPNSKHATNMRHPSHQYHPQKPSQVGHGPSQMNPTRRDANFPRDPSKPREPQSNSMFPPIIRHDPNGSNSNPTTAIVTPPPSSISSKPVVEMGDDKTRPKPQSVQRPPEHFNHKYPNPDHRHRRDPYQPDGGHHPYKNPGDPSKYHTKPRPQIPGLEAKKEDEQNKRLSIHPSNNSKPPPSRTPVAPPPSKQSKTRLSKNGTSESVPILPTTHNYGSSNLVPLNPSSSNSSYTTTITTTTTTTTTTLSSSTILPSTASHSLSPPDLTNPTAVSNLLHATPPQQVRQPRESPYPSRKPSTMPHPLVPNRQRTNPLSPLNSPAGKPSRSSNRNRTNSSSSEELVPVVKKIDQIPGYESVSISGGIKLPGQVPEMIQPIRDRRKDESSSLNQLPPPLPTNSQPQISNRTKDDIPTKELNKIKEDVRVKEDKQTTQVSLKEKEPIQPVISENSRISSSSIDQSIIDVVSIPEPPSEKVRLDTVVTQDDASKSKKATKHHKSDKKKRKEKSKDKEKDKDRDKEKKKKKHKEKDKEREKLKETQSSQPIKIKIPKDKLNLKPTPEPSTESNSSGLKIKIPKDRLVQSETPTTSAPSSTTGSSTTHSQGGLKIKISKDVYENFNKEPRKRPAPDTHPQAPPAKAPRVSESRHRNPTTMPYGKQNGQPTGVGGYNKMSQKMAESINVQSKGKNSTSSHP